MHKVALRLKVSLTGALTLVIILWLFGAQTWTLVYYSARTVENGII